MGATIVRNLKIYECCVIEFDAADSRTLPLTFRHYDNAYALDGASFNERLKTFAKDVLEGSLLLHPSCDYFEEFEAARAVAKGLMQTYGISISNDFTYGINGVGTINDAVARLIVLPKLHRINPDKGYMLKLMQIARSVNEAYESKMATHKALGWIKSNACYNSDVFPELDVFWLDDGAIAIGPKDELYMPNHLGNMNNSTGNALIIEDGEDIVDYLAYGNLEIRADLKDKTNRVLSELGRKGYRIKNVPYTGCDLKALGLEVS